MPHLTVYILKCSDGSYYTGCTSDLTNRLNEHQIGKFVSAYTYNRRPVELVYSQNFSLESEAIKWENRIKGLKRSKKEALINGNIELLKELSNKK
ncbi:MAG: GIY-YIG nuclease family protein [Flavobacteriales bacterium]|nr:GIY-YIG nuclease family protein [Flavobacteriales bacterium]